MKVKSDTNSMQLIKSAVFKYGPLSRSKLAELLQVTPPTVTNNISLLIEEGLIEEVSPETTANLGRKPIAIDYIPSSRYSIGIDLGPYSTYITICDLKGKPYLSRTYPAASMDYSQMLSLLTAWLEELLCDSRIASDHIIGIGIGTPGFIEHDNQTIRQCFRTNWNGKNLSKDLSGLTGFPVVSLNNAHVRAMKLDLLDASVQADLFAYLYVSHGIACPLVIKHGLLSSEILGAGETGHMTMDLNGRQCDVCGRQGCLEAYASERAILKRAEEARSLGMETMLPPSPTFKDILQAQTVGDQLVCHIMNEAMMYLGLAIANIINFISPPLLFIDGYMMRSESNRNQLLSVIYKNIYSFTNNELDIRFVDFDIYYGSIGAAACAVKTFFIQS